MTCSGGPSSLGRRGSSRSHPWPRWRRLQTIWPRSWERTGLPAPWRRTSWEEPSSAVVTAEPAPPRQIGRNLPAATITGVILGVAVLVSLAVSKGAFAVVAGLVVLIAQGELYSALHKKNLQPATALGL